MARRILLADDSVTAQNMGRKILADAGYEVITVNNGSAALKKIAENRPDLIILDVYMPGYSGVEVCSRLKESSETARIPVLLTVGKLEPFKPDEASRVRADAFIVKPFEASELLSVLTRLEDKIVPRPEASKPGRFARAIAAVEESGRTGVADDQSGWAKRIAFPKKKEPAEATPEDGSALYNAVNRDLRTVVQQSPAPSASTSHPAAAGTSPGRHNDSGASSPVAGALPSDVTPEEIAALAAAAAQVQAEASSAKRGEQVQSTPETPQRPIAKEPPSVPAHDAAPVKVEPAAARSMAPAVASPDQEFAAPAHIAAQAAPESAPSSSQAEHADVPVTLAANPVDGGSDAARWMAVAVQVDASEAALSLEQEMRGFYAAVAAMDIALAGPDAAQAITDITTLPPTNGNGSRPSAASIATEASAQAAAIQRDNSREPRPETAAGGEHPAPDAALPSSQPTHSAATMQAVEAVINEMAAAVEQPSPVSQGAVAPKLTEVEGSDESRPPALAAVPAAGPAAAAEITPPPIPAAASEIAGTSQGPAAESALAPSAASAEDAGDTKPGAFAERGKVERESEFAATTAAAWATWRQIRDGAPSKLAASSQSLQAEGQEEQPHAPGPAETVPAEPVPAEETKPGVHFRTVRISESKPAWTSASGESSEEKPQAGRELSDHAAALVAKAAAAGAQDQAGDGSSSPDFDPSLTMIVDSVLNDLRPKIAEEIAKKLRQKK